MPIELTKSARRELDTHADAIERAILSACKLWGVDRELIRTHNSCIRTKAMADVRGAICWALRKATKMSYPSIAHAVQMKDHTSVMLSIRRFEKRIADDWDVWSKCDDVLDAALGEPDEGSE